MFFEGARCCCSLVLFRHTQCLGQWLQLNFRRLLTNRRGWGRLLSVANAMLALDVRETVAGRRLCGEGGGGFLPFLHSTLAPLLRPRTAQEPNP